MASDWLPGFPPEEGRLNSLSGWMGGFWSTHYFLVDLLQVYNISGLRLQSSFQWPEHVVQTMRLLYSVNGFGWSFAFDSDRRVLATGLTPSVVDKSMAFPQALTMRYLVINPVQWIGAAGPTLRVELFGCPLNTSTPEQYLYLIVEDIDRDTVWKAKQSYVIFRVVRVWPAAVLTIEEGVQIYFATKEAGILVDGVLLTNGSSLHPVVFQSSDILSYLRDSYYWKGLVFTKSDGVIPSILYHTIIKGAQTGVAAVGNSVLLDSVEITDCEVAIRLESGQQKLKPWMESCLLKNNGMGVEIYNVTGEVMLDNVTFSNHTYISIAAYFQTKASPEVASKFLLNGCTIEYSTYAVYLASSKQIAVDLMDCNISNVMYGTYLDFYREISATDISVATTSFTGILTYALIINFQSPGITSETSNVTTKIVDCVFSNCNTGFEYNSPYLNNGFDSTVVLQSNLFRNLQAAVSLNLRNQASYTLINNTYVNNTGTVLSVKYLSMSSFGVVDGNIFVNNYILPNSITPDGNSNLIEFLADDNLRWFANVIFTNNILALNRFKHILWTAALQGSIIFNGFDDPEAICEICLEMPWKLQVVAVNTSLNWWGTDGNNDTATKILTFTKSSGRRRRISN